MILTVGIAIGALSTASACSTSTSNQPATTAPTSASTSAPAAATHNPADVMFAQQMIPHHQQAIQMSDIILGKQGVDARVVDLANQIKAAQGPEIAQMQGWLGQWGQSTMPMMPGMQSPASSATPTPPTAATPPPDTHHTTAATPPGTPTPSPTTGMPGSSMMPGMPNQSGMMPSMSGMPGTDGMMGMISEADMAALQNAQGVEASKLFLTQMIQHHQGAIMMAQHEIAGGQYPAAVALAHSIATSQQQQITDMQNLLGSL